MKSKVITLLIILSLLGSGCAIISSISVKNDYQEITFEKLPECFGLLQDDTLLYYCTGDRSVQYYAYGFEEQKNQKLGGLQGHYILNYAATVYKDNLYFYVITFSGGKECHNQFYAINLTQNELKEIEREENSLGDIRAFPLGERIVALKKEQQQDRLITYVDSYYPATDTWERCCVKVCKEAEKMGSTICAIHADGKYLYAIEKRYENGVGAYFFVTYHADFQEENSFLLPEEIAEFVHKKTFTEMRVWNHFIYLKNTLNEGVIGYLENQNIEKLYGAEKLWISATVCPNDEPIFYIHDTNIYFTLDAEHKKIVQHSTIEPYQFLEWATSSNAAVFVTNQKRGDIKLIYVKREKLDKI